MAHPPAEVWYAIPSASPEKARETLPAWRERGYRVAVLQNQERGEVPADRVLWSDHYPGWAGSINRLIRELVPASAGLIVSGGDDMLPDPDRGAAELAAEFFERFPDGFGVMQPCGDPFFGSENFCGSPWLGRGFCDAAYGGRGPLWAGYRHNWADVELHNVAGALGALWMRPEVTQAHEHFSRSGEPEPAWWSRNVAAADRRDVELLLARRYAGFPGHEPLGGRPPLDRAWLVEHVKPVAERVWLDRYSRDALGVRHAAQTLAEALEASAAAGHRAVAVYGAGDHTRRAAAALARPPVPVAAVLDDGAPPPGADAAGCARFLGFPLLPPGALLDPPAGLPAVDAVILSGDSVEDRLWANAAPLRAAGLAVVRLYGGEAAGGPVGAARGPGGAGGPGEPGGSGGPGGPGEERG